MPQIIFQANWSNLVNAKAERLEDALLDIVKSKLSESGVLICYWPDAHYNSKFVRNGVLEEKLGNVTC